MVPPPLHRLGRGIPISGRSSRVVGDRGRVVAHSTAMTDVRRVDAGRCRRHRSASSTSCAPDLRDLRIGVVAFSGGADSAFLAAVAHEVLGAAACARRHRRVAVAWRGRARRLRGAGRRMAAAVDAGGHPRDGARRLPHQRRRPVLPLQGRVDGRAWPRSPPPTGPRRARGQPRRPRRPPPGQRAAVAGGAVFPLVEAGFTKHDVREASTAARVCARGTSRPRPVWRAACRTAPRCRCRSSAGSTRRGGVARARASRQCRVRHYDDTARIEVELDAAATGCSPVAGGGRRPSRRAGYRYVTLDLEGFRSGNLNAALA